MSYSTQAIVVFDELSHIQLWILALLIVDVMNFILLYFLKYSANIHSYFSDFVKSVDCKQLMNTGVLHNSTRLCTRIVHNQFLFKF